MYPERNQIKEKLKRFKGEFMMTKVITQIYLFGTLILLSGCYNHKKLGRGNEIPKQYDSLYTMVQRNTFDYFWSGAEPNSGLARERVHEDGQYPRNDKDVVTTGGSGFGVMAILAGMERGFITREEGRERMKKIVGFLEKADRFHGAWPHWMEGGSGKVKPFGPKDDGGDLVETSFMLEGLLCARQYYKDGNPEERALANRIDQLWRTVEFDWYRNGKNILFWHWSPDYGWAKNFGVTGYNECLIMYILAASSPTHGVPKAVYDEGWAKGGKIRDTTRAYGYTLTLSHNGNNGYGGPLFWAHYSWMGLDPRGLKDRYADYWANNQAQALMDYSWCSQNPKQFKGYGPDSWGLTSSYSVRGYGGHAPGYKRDLGVIAPTAALSSMPYTPQQSLAAMYHWYKDLGDSLYGPFGFYDAFSETAGWFPKRYLAIDEGPIVVMMENYRTGLLWRLFMSCPEVRKGLKKLGFQSPWIR